MECSAAPAMIAQDIIKMLEDRGRGDYIGESISQLEHCLQCADLGRKAGQDDDIIIAALLHDIGQFLPVDEARDISMGIGEENVGRVGHESIGEEYLKRLGFGEKITRLVGSHVAAKRYLTAVDEAYYDGLSDASKRSLKHQGGPFQGDELEAFRRDPLKDTMVMLRKWDDQAKTVGIEHVTPRATEYTSMIEHHLAQQLHSSI